MKSGLATLASLFVVQLSACGGGATNNASHIGHPENQTASTGDTVYCRAVEQRVSLQECEDLTREDAGLRRGVAAFNVPDPMRRGDTVEVHLVIDRRSPRLIRILEARGGSEIATIDGNMMAGNSVADPGTNSVSGTDDPQNLVEPDGGDPAPTPSQIVNQLEGTPETFFPLVGRHMRAELTGQGFDIVAKTEVSQEIPLGGQGTWIWEVTAREGGARSLSLMTLVESVANGRRYVLARTPKVRSVTVDVSLSNRIWDFLVATPTWIKAVTAVVVAFGGLLTALYGLRWFRRRRDSRNGGASDKGDDVANGADGEPE
jgi:hypothetical protein